MAGVPRRNITAFTHPETETALVPYTEGDDQDGGYYVEEYWNDQYNAWVAWDADNQTYENSGEQSDPAYYVFGPPDQYGQQTMFGTLDGGETWPIELPQTPEWTYPEEEEAYTFAAITPELSHTAAQDAIWGVDQEGGFECLAVYARGAKPKGKPGRHEKEGDGVSQKNKDGLTCHRCGSDLHFGNNCSRPPVKLPRRKGTGRPKGQKGGGGPPRAPKGKPKGKGFLAWEDTPNPNAYYETDEYETYWGKGGRPFRRFVRRPKGKGKGRRPKGKGRGRMIPGRRRAHFAEEGEDYGDQGNAYYPDEYDPYYQPTFHAVLDSPETLEPLEPEVYRYTSESGN